MMDAQGRVWGQDMILQVRDHELLLSDIETKEELESFPLESVQACAAVLNCCVYNSILAITVREQSQHGSSILLFQCEQLGAELMKANLEKAVKEWKGERESQDVLRSSLETMLSQQSRRSFHSNPPHTSQDRWAGLPEPVPFIPPTPRGWQSQDQVPQNPPASMDYAPDQPQPPKPRDEWTDPGLQAMQDFDKDTEILNHVLSDIELFVGKLKETSRSLSIKKKSKKKDKERRVLPPEPEYETCFQKIKYALNLLGKLKPKLQQQPPSAPELVRIMFSTLSFILSNCPWPNLASSIVSPLLTEAAIDLLDESLEKKDRDTWKSLGKAWDTMRTEYPGGQFIPPYIPIFSDGWVPPLPTQRENTTHLERQPLGSQNHATPRAPSSPPQRMQAMYEFQARNNKELTVMKGELLEILDQRKKWWLARNSAGERGYIPNNIVGPVDQEPAENSMNHVPSGSPGLQQHSTPAEVTAWLRDMGFSKITVKCLGVLNGKQLLGMSQKEMKTVCPEEGRRVFFKLSAVKSSLGIGPHD
uniref:SH3 domain-containing protein n=1 Tax=Gopherus agassizii TaxID=38772 RepID=A0A452IPV5_9SAUR